MGFITCKNGFYIRTIFKPLKKQIGNLWDLF